MYAPAVLGFRPHSAVAGDDIFGRQLREFRPGDVLVIPPGQEALAAGGETDGGPDQSR